MKFRTKKYNFLIVTDLAARGIDIPLLENVIHYDFPTNLKMFIHRSGRTARAGQKGTAYCLVTTAELGYLHDLSIYVGRKYADSPEFLERFKQTHTTEDGVITHNTEKVSPQKVLEDPIYICFGRMP
jgi:superfamily II DNA/RNA helicase